MALDLVPPGTPIVTVSSGSSGPAPSGQPTSSVNTGSSVSETSESDLSTGRGIVPYYFYSAANAAAQLLLPGPAAALSPPLPFRCSIVAIEVVCAGSNSGTYTVHIDGTAISGAAVILSSATSGYEAFPRGTYQASAGQTIDVRATSVSGANALAVIVHVEMDPTSVV